MAKFENDLSKGNVVKQLIIFAMPFLAILALATKKTLKIHIGINENRPFTP